MLTPRNSALDLKSRFNLELNDIKPVSIIAQSKYPVYLVKNTKTNTNFALKVYPGTETARSSFKIEKRMVYFHHENITSYFESSAINDPKFTQSTYLLMEYSALGDLGSLFINEKIPLSEKLARTLFKSVLAGIEYLHSNEVFHLDIKPDNILIDHKGTIKIADFDSCYIEGVDGSIVSLGTQNFRAPELCLGECQDPRAADVYSLGISLFCFRTGSVPFSEDITTPRMENLIKMVIEKSDAFWTEHSKISGNKLTYTKEFKDLFWRLTEINPKKRISLKDVKKHPWMNGPVYTQKELLAFLVKR
jgi:serine/threonine protein kinase